MPSPNVLDSGNEQVTGEAVALDLRPTGFVLRAAGAIIDFLVSIGLWILLLLAINSPVVKPMLDSASAAAASIAALVICIVILPTVVETATQGKSLGRLAVGARIVRDDGGSIGFRHAFIRAVIGTIEIFSTLGGLASVVALLNSRSQRLGDLLAGTYSQNERVPKIIDSTFGVPPSLQQWSVIADVARMPDGLSRRIAQFLAQAARLTPEARERIALELAAETARWVLPVPPGSAELFLAAVVVVRRERESLALALERQKLESLAPALTGVPHDYPNRS